MYIYTHKEREREKEFMSLRGGKEHVHCLAPSLAQRDTKEDIVREVGDAQQQRNDGVIQSSHPLNNEQTIKAKRDNRKQERI